MRCPHCGNQIPDTTRACGHCGQWLDAAPTRRGLPGWVWGIVGGIVVLVAVVGVLLATGVIELPGQQAPAPPVTSAPAPTSTSPPLPTQTLEATEMATTESAPTPTAESVSTPEALLYDGFSDPTSGWPKFGDDLGGEVGYGDDAFRIAFSRPGPGFHAAWSPEQYADFTVETLFSVPEGVPEAGAGLTLRTTSDG